MLSGLIFGAILAGAVVAIYILPQNSTAGAAKADPPETPSAVNVRSVRVLIGSGTDRLFIRSNAEIEVRTASNGATRTLPSDSWIEWTSSSNERLVTGDGTVWSSDVTLDTAASAIWVSFSNDNHESDKREYPGRLRVTARGDKRLDVINEVPAELYVASVTAGEIWPTFHVQACRAQAIVARSYVLYQMSRRNQHPFDVSATQGSQVYGGLRRDSTGERAADAASHTRGLVLTWHDGVADRLFCAYYSAACGGMTQSAALFGPDGEVPPLAGGIRCDYCRIAPGETYRWGPVRLDWDELRTRLRARYPDIDSLGSLRSIRIGERTEDGRALTIQLTGSSGESYELLAERFRFAVGAGIIRSTAFTIDHDRRGVVFSNGKGFGHGLGLCQWGMEGQAREGRTADAILKYYYPGARLTRVY
jgi:stage II sporulation protein D